MIPFKRAGHGDTKNAAYFGFIKIDEVWYFVIANKNEEFVKRRLLRKAFALDEKDTPCWIGWQLFDGDAVVPGRPQHDPEHVVEFDPSEWEHPADDARRVKREAASASKQTGTERAGLELPPAHSVPSPRRIPKPKPKPKPKNAKRSTSEIIRSRAEGRFLRDL